MDDLKNMQARILEEHARLINEDVALLEYMDNIREDGAGEKDRHTQFSHISREIKKKDNLWKEASSKIFQYSDILSKILDSADIHNPEKTQEDK